MISAAVAGLIVLLFQVYAYKLPYLVVEGAFDPVFEVYQESQPWEFLASFIVGVAVLLFYPAIALRKKLFFLDCMVIHQTDMELKMAGECVRCLPVHTVSNKRV